jgi:hypothetical protein
MRAPKVLHPLGHGAAQPVDKTQVAGGQSTQQDLLGGQVAVNQHPVIEDLERRAHIRHQGRPTLFGELRPLADAAKDGDRQRVELARLRHEQDSLAPLVGVVARHPALFLLRQWDRLRPDVVPDQRAGALNGDGRLEQIGHSTPLRISYGSGDHGDPVTPTSVLL